MSFKMSLWRVVEPSNPNEFVVPLIVMVALSCRPIEPLSLIPISLRLNVLIVLFIPISIRFLRVFDFRHQFITLAGVGRAAATADVRFVMNFVRERAAG